MKKDKDMEIQVFQYSSYIRLLLELIAQNRPIRGAKSRLAKAMSCRLSYLSQVLGGKAQLSLEQAYACGAFFALSDSELEYFMLLVQIDRAGTRSLKEFFRSKIKEAQAQHQNLSARVKVSMPLSQIDQSQYYSTWEYAAVHVATSLKDIQSAKDIAEKLGMSVRRVEVVLGVLESMSLVSMADGRPSITANRLHLSNEKISISQHHSNWRLQSIRALEREGRDDLFYSSVVSLSVDDYLRIREILVKSVTKVKSVVRQSPEHVMAAFNIDFYALQSPREPD